MEKNAIQCQLKMHSESPWYFSAPVSTFIASDCTPHLTFNMKSQYITTGLSCPMSHDFMRLREHSESCVAKNVSCDQQLQ